MRLTLGAAVTSMLLLLALGAPPVPILLGTTISCGLIWWRSVGAR
jgi:hypothetical protein